MDKRIEAHSSDPEEGSRHLHPSSSIPLDQVPKSRWERSWPTIACGAGLFSDGYVQSVIGSVNTILGQIYGKAFTNSPQRKNVNAIAFAGTVVGQLVFGVLSDYWSRKNSLLISTIILIIFSALPAGAYGAGGTLGGMLAALTAYRFLVGIGVGGEYPAGSVGAAESSAELKTRPSQPMVHLLHQFSDRPRIRLWHFGANDLRPDLHRQSPPSCVAGSAWTCRGSPLSLLWLRIKLKEPEEYNRQRMTTYPYMLIIKFYWFRLLVVSIIWFIYDFLTYSFGIYSSSWIYLILGDSYPLWVSLGWSTLINAFYIPGAFIGAFTSDWIGPKYALVAGVTAQGVVGFIMSGLYGYLNTPAHVAGFVVVYGIFLAVGEIGPGDNIGLVASKTCATAIRGQYYGIAAAMGKIGAFVGSYVFPIIQAAAGDDKVKAGQYPFYVSSSLCFFSAAIALFLLPNIGQDTIEEEDIKFRAYLEENGFDTSTMGSKEFREANVVDHEPKLDH
ncbi:glycerophosphoinositol permease [Knufia obscura]|uniref:Glycerophosphoinositol permease n=1 Tax=Knufia obscura TaxID=1635080 RepID=A0ABR0RPY5_9EURO|nr:glycerophosphoinositol permease [Knufia obscura]